MYVRTVRWAIIENAVVKREAFLVNVQNVMVILNLVILRNHTIDMI